MAVKNNNETIVKFLISIGADVNHPNEVQYHYARASRSITHFVPNVQHLMCKVRHKANIFYPMSLPARVNTGDLK